VVACGGGVVLDKDNVRLMKKTGVMVCLRATPEEILQRVSSNRDRPLLNVASPMKRIELLLKMRSPYYMQADKIVDTCGLSVKQVARKISGLFSGRKIGFSPGVNPGIRKSGSAGRRKNHRCLKRKRLLSGRHE
jgi:shikimate kinase